MKNRIRGVLACLLTLAMLFGVAACKGPEEGGGGEAIDTAIPTDTEARLIALVDNDASEKTLLDALAAEFNKIYPKITIEVQQTSDMLSYIRSGDQVDLVQCIGENVSNFAANGTIADLGPYLQASGFDTSLYYESMIQLGKEGASGKTYMLPRDYSRIVCFYNKKIFDQCQLAYPADDWSWDQFLTTCEALKGNANFPDNYTVVQGSMSYDILNWGIVSSYGVKNLLKSDFTLTDDTTVKTNWQRGMQTAADMIARGYSLGSSKYAPDDFSKGVAAMALSQGTATISYNRNEIDYDVVSFPAIGDNPKSPAGTSGYSIAKVSKNKNASWAFLNFIMSRRGQEVVSETAGLVPVLKSLAEDSEAGWRGMKNGAGKPINVKALISHSDRDVVSDWFGSLPSLAQSAYKGFYNTFLKNVCDGNKSFAQGYATLSKNISDYKRNYPEYFA